MMKEDSDPEKRQMKGQTRVKHDILKKYLQPWLMKITEVSSNVRYVDGFAGWGRYEDGSPGSPIIAMEAAKTIIEEDYGQIASKLDEFLCTFIEADETNYLDLEREVKSTIENCPSQIRVQCENMDFKDYAKDFVEVEEETPFPSFIFIDPFGFSGLPFNVVKDIMNLRATGTEVFVTFVAGEMARFLDSDTHERAITEILGTNRWKVEIDPGLPKEEKVDELLRIYEEQLRKEANANYVWPFRMSRESKDETVYYLIHATNHFDGFKLMKDIMYNAGADERFAYLGPNHYPYLDEQEAITNFGSSERETDRRIEDLANQLYDKLPRDKSITFFELMERTYQETYLIEKHYRKAIYLLEEQDRAKIINHPQKPEGTINGLSDGDEIEFHSITGLSDFT